MDQVEMLNDTLVWQLHGGVARVVLAAPRTGNALNSAMARALHEAARRVEEGAVNGSIRVVVLAAQGQAFCVGGDLREFAAAKDRGRQVKAVADQLHAAILLLAGVPVPVVSVVQGTVAGGGVGLALAADVVLMAEEAKLRLAYTAAGLSPDCGSTWILSRRLGAPRALDLALSNRIVTGNEAAQWGLVSRAVPRDHLEKVSEELIDGLRRGPAHAYTETKRLMAAGPHRALASSLADEAATIGQLIVGADAVEGVDAFLEKRAPTYN